MFTDFERDPLAETGVRFEDFITAVGMYVYTNENDRKVSVADVAAAFNTSREVALEAVKAHPWLFVREGQDAWTQFIESDGE